jgi:hypothetical protein
MIDEIIHGHVRGAAHGDDGLAVGDAGSRPGNRAAAVGPGWAAPSVSGGAAAQSTSARSERAASWDPVGVGSP